MFTLIWIISGIISTTIIGRFLTTSKKYGDYFKVKYLFITIPFGALAGFVSLGIFMVALLAISIMKLFELKVLKNFTSSASRFFNKKVF